MRYFPYSLAAIAALLCVPTLRAETALDIMLRDGTLRRVALADGMTFSLSGTTLTATSESSSISIEFDDIQRMVYALDSHASLAAPTQQSISVECSAGSLDIKSSSNEARMHFCRLHGRGVDIVCCSPPHAGWHITAPDDGQRYMFGPVWDFDAASRTL